MDVTDPSMTGIDYQLQQLWALLSGVNSVVAVLGLVAIAVVVYLLKPAKWWAIAILLDVSSFSSFGFTGDKIIAPLAQIRLYGRAIVAALLVALLLPSILSDRGWRLRLITPATMFFLLFESIVAIRTEGALRMVLDILTYLVIFSTLGLGLARWVQSLEDANDAVKAVAMAGVLFLLGSYTQVAIDLSQVVWNGRFLGTTGNPNHAGAVLAITLLAMLYLLLSAQTPYRWRVFFGLAAILNVVTLLWTGSRTALLMAIVGVAVQFRRRLGALVVVGMLAAVVGLIIWQASAVDDSSGRLLSLEDTRSAIWMGMIRDFVQSPLIGDNTGWVVGTENSYLLIAAKTGLVGLVPLILSLGALVPQLVGNWRGRRSLRQFSPLADLVLASILAELAGAFFEGYLIGVYTLPVLTLYIYFTLAGFVSDVQVIAKTQGAQELEPDDYPVDAELSFRQYGHANY